MKIFQFRLCYGLLQIFIFKLRHFPTACTNQMMMGFILIRTFILRCISKLVFNNQSGINQQYDSIIKSGTAYTEFFFFRHVTIQHVYIEMSLYRINRIQYSITFGRFSMSVFADTPLVSVSPFLLHSLPCHYRSTSKDNLFV